MKRKGFTISLITIVISLLFPNILFATGGDMGIATELLTDGSESYPYLIEDFADFQSFCADPNYWASGVHTILMTDVDLDPSLSGRQTYTQAPIAGDTDNDSIFDGIVYAGAFNGNNHVVANLTINCAYYCGLFGKLAAGADVTNLELENASITGSEDYVGSLAGYNQESNIKLCSSSGMVTGNQDTGGLVGKNEGYINNCCSTAAVTGYNRFGGLVGWNSGSITNCYATGTITGNNRAGGLVGWNPGSISDCYATGTVTGSSYVGGLVGYNNYGSINDCYSFGDVSGISKVGGLAGANYSGDISNCYATGTVSGKNSIVGGLEGGLVGYNRDGSSISHCYATGVVTGEENVGGLVGQSDASCSIINCYSTGSVTGEDQVGGLTGQNKGYISVCNSTGAVTGNFSVGGLTGTNSGNVSYCSSTGMVTGNQDTGGLVGQNGGSGSSINDCYSTGAVSGSRWVGGLVGNCSSGSISNCYSTGMVKGLDDFIGGLTGTNGGSIINCYSVGMVNGAGYTFGGLAGSNYGSITNSYFYIYSGPDNGLGLALDDAQLQDKESFVGFDFAENPSDGMDDIWTIESGYMPRLSWQTSPGYEAPYILDTITTTLTGTGYPNDPFIIADYNDLTEFRNNSELRVGYYSLTADIDLNPNMLGRQIYTQAFIPEDFQGSFHGNGYTISNLTIEGDNCLGFFSDLYGSVDNLAIENVLITSTGSAIGGLTSINYGYISRCYSTGAVSGYYSIGGLVGYNAYYGSISDCYTTGMVAGNSYVAGLVGHNGYYSSIINCYSTGVVTGNYTVGGLVGDNSGYTSGSFWDVEISGITTSDGGEGLTTEQMQIQSTFTDAGWDFTTPVWTIDEGVDYPRLWWELDSIDLLGMLADDVIELIQDSGIANGLLAKLDTAIQKLTDDNENNDAAAVNSLQAFINAVDAQRGKKISEEDADYFITAAQQIIDMFNIS